MADIEVRIAFIQSGIEGIQQAQSAIARLLREGGADVVNCVSVGVVGGEVQALVERLVAGATVPAEVYLTGGDGHLLAKALNQDVHPWPNMTLEGIRIAAETMP